MQDRNAARTKAEARTGRPGARLPLLRGLLAVVTVWTASSFAPAQPGPALGASVQADALPQASDIPGRIEVKVLDQADDQPLMGAAVSVPELALGGSTDAAGVWRAQRALSGAEQIVTVTVTAPGYGVWTMQAVRVIAADILYLTARLGPAPVVEQAQTPAIRAEMALQPAGGWDEPFLTSGPDQTGLPLPATIRVRVTSSAHCDLTRPYEVRWVDFRQYLKNVLPNEWGASWARESLRAGALAVKMYAWAQIARGGKWPDADVYDSTCDQVYRPSIAYASTNAAVDDTWPWRLTRSNRIFATYYRAYAAQCPATLAGNCLGQWESKDRADAGAGFAQILSEFYVGSRLNLHLANHALRFSGGASAGQDRFRVPIDGPATAADVGAGSFTIEFWLRAEPGSNMIWDAARPPAVTCGPNDGWLNGSVLLDRDSAGTAMNGDYGLALVSGRIAFGVNNGLTGATLCSAGVVDDGVWRHVAVTRNSQDGWLRIWIDGRLDAEAQGPVGDISYADGRPPAAEGDPWLMVGGRKIDSDPALRLAFTGWLDELRLSTTERYTDTARVYPTYTRYSPDAITAALYHFDDVAAAGACTGAVLDSAAAASASGSCLAGGGSAPEYVPNDNPSQWVYVYLPGIQRELPAQGPDPAR